jgi:RNA polymerase sigma-70 factor, ECF subfamily
VSLARPRPTAQDAYAQPQSDYHRYIVIQETDPDSALVERTRHGDLGAFEALVERHRDVVYRVAARIVGPDEADDVSQDAFLRAFHRLDSFKSRAPFRAWLLQITHNAAISAAERRRPTPVGAQAQEETEPDTPASERRPAESLERKEREQRLRIKLSRLRPSYRGLVVLRDIEGLSYEEIAQLLEMPIGSVKGRLHRARGELIELLRNNTYDWDLPS